MLLFYFIGFAEVRHWWSTIHMSSSLLDGPGAVVGVLLSAPVPRIGTTAFERCFMAFCMFWSLNLTGVFQVTMQT